MFPVVRRLLTWVVVSAALAAVSYSAWNVVCTVSTRHHSPSMPTEVPPKYAFVTFLASHTGPRDFSHDNADSADIHEDSHFVAVRMLVYRLLHAPSTRPARPIPVMVMVTPDVSPAKVDRLKRDGAVVVETPRLDANWGKSFMPRHMANETVLRMFQLTTFKRILYLDANTLVTRPLEAIFRDPAAVTFPTGFRAARAADEGRLPVTYSLVALGEPPPRHVRLAKEGDHFSAKCILFQPDVLLFQHYVSIMNAASRVPGGFAEPDVLNHAHRRSGNMPWKRLDRRWDTSFMSWGDDRDGVVTPHDTWWSWQSTEGPDTRLMELWRLHRHEMESFYRDRS